MESTRQTAIVPTRIKNKLWAAFIILALGLCQYGIREIQFDRNYLVPEGHRYLGLTLNPKIINRLLGVRIAVADIVWLDFLLKADHNRFKSNYTALYKAAKTVVELDPDYLYGYYVAGLYLSVITEDIKGATDLLRMGTRHMETHPTAWKEAWRLPFTLAFNLLYEENELDEGAYWMQKAAAMPNVAQFVVDLSRRISTEQGRLELGARILGEMRMRVKTPEARAQVEHKMVLLSIRQDLVDLNQRFQDYLQRSGAYAFKKERAFQLFMRSIGHSGVDLLGQKYALNELGKISSPSVTLK